jgi:glycosyltransferase involved in cell wall biosynthesis
MQYAEFNIRLFLKLLFTRTDYLLANDLDTLVPNYLVSRLRGKKIFYDTHEYFTGVPELRASPLKKKTWKFFENWIFPRLPLVYTVNDSVRKKYQQEYGNQIEVIRNVPVTVKVTPVPMPERWMNRTVLLMQGTGINPGRGGLELLAAMKYLPPTYLLVYIGGGTLWDDIAARVKEWGLAEKVEMIGKMRPADLKRHTPLATLGFTLDGTGDENFLFNLPNKIFDYIHAGVPVVGTPIPEVRLIIEQYRCGICLESLDPAVMARQIQELVNDPQRYQLFKQNTILAAKDLCWENEEVKLQSIFRPYLT